MDLFFFYFIIIVIIISQKKADSRVTSVFRLQCPLCATGNTADIMEAQCTLR